MRSELNRRPIDSSFDSIPNKINELISPRWTITCFNQIELAWLYIIQFADWFELYWELLTRIWDRRSTSNWINLDHWLSADDKVCKLSLASVRVNASDWLPNREFIIIAILYYYRLNGYSMHSYRYRCHAELWSVQPSHPFRSPVSCYLCGQPYTTYTAPAGHTCAQIIMVSNCIEMSPPLPIQCSCKHSIINLLSISELSSLKIRLFFYEKYRWDPMLAWLESHIFLSHFFIRL